MIDSISFANQIVSCVDFIVVMDRRIKTVGRLTKLMIRYVIG